MPSPQDRLVQIEVSQLKRLHTIAARLRKKGADMKPFLKLFNIYMLKETDLTFDKGGRGPIKWKRLAPMTIKMRAWRAKYARGGKRTNPRKILQDRGTLRASIKYIVAKRRGVDAAVIFTPTPYAPQHQFGGTGTQKARTIRPRKKGGVLRFRVGGKVVYAKYAKQPARTYTIPQRKFLFFTAQNEKKAETLLLEYERDVTKDTVK